MLTVYQSYKMPDMSGREISSGSVLSNGFGASDPRYISDFNRITNSTIRRHGIDVIRTTSSGEYVIF